MYIKISLEEAENFDMVVTEAIAKLPNLKLEVGVDIRKYLIYTIIKDFSYIRMGLFDLVNHNRMYPASMEEVAMWENMVLSNNWETVDKLPVMESV